MNRGTGHKGEPAWKSWALPAEGEVVDMWDWQDGHCAMCGFDRHSRRMAADHCHDTGFVRGYLCSGCNTDEGTSSDPIWDGWRNGDNPAHAFKYFEVYRNSSGVTAISNDSALRYYTYQERMAWWREVEASVAAGGDIPTRAPWTPEATARRDLEQVELRAALTRMGDLLFPNGYGQAAS